MTSSILTRSISLRGKGIHTGQISQVWIHPAEESSGILFQKQGITIPARLEYVTDTSRCTSLGNANIKIDTVEHILSALNGLGIRDALIDIEGSEVPILDGSAYPWVQALEPCIKPAQHRDSPDILSEAFSFQFANSWYCATPSRHFALVCVTQFDHPLLGAQSAIFQSARSNYLQDIAPARTFGFIEEIEALRQQGLALGGALDNALVIYPDHFSDQERIPDECCRHKLLDMIGDFALLNEQPGATITAVRPGHAGNIAFARILEQKLHQSSKT